jgi:hypothetical protein
VFSARRLGRGGVFVARLAGDDLGTQSRLSAA